MNGPAYRILADAVVLLHLGFILFVAFGALAATRWRWLVLLHLPALAWGIAVEAAGWYCPLTGAEIWLRLLAGQAGYGGGFIEHYVLALIYPAGLTRAMQWGLAGAVLALNLALYARLWRTLSGRPLQRSPGRTPRPAPATRRTRRRC